MINDRAWQAANRFAGTALALLSVFAMLLHVGLWSLIETDPFAQTASVGLILALPFLVMYLTEKYLARLLKN